MSPTRSCAISASEIAKCPINCGGDQHRKKTVDVDETTADIIDLKSRIHATIEALIWAGYTRFLTSATRGIELWAAEAVLALEEEYPEVTLEIVVPYAGHSKEWAAPIKERYDEVLAQADTVTRLNHETSKGAVFTRNHYLLDNCSSLITAYYEGSMTETLATRAQRSGKQVARIPFMKKAA